MKKILTEASGSLTAAYLLKAIQDSGNLAVASDIDPRCAGRFLADDFILMPHKDDAQLWEKVNNALLHHKVDIVIPSLDETLPGWAERKGNFLNQGIYVISSSVATVRTFQDKWLTYQFFRDAGIPTPATSLEQKYSLLKPRCGRGAAGIRITHEAAEMEGMISQELVSGVEYTVDVFCDRDSKPIYIVPRRRIGVKEGKSTGGIVVNHSGIEMWVREICSLIPFQGPINVQCFVCEDGTIKFIEINTRIAGGMALGFAATENWMDVIVRHFICRQEINPKPIQYGMEMKRYYAEVFIPPCGVGAD